MALEAAYAQGAGAADRVFEELERYAIANDEIVDRRALVHISTVEEDVAAVGQTDKSVSLADKQLDDSPAGDHATLDRAGAGSGGRRWRSSGRRVRARSLTSAARIVVASHVRRRSRRDHHRRHPRPWDAPR
jgi:hypothetical protein